MSNTISPFTDVERALGDMPGLQHMFTMVGKVVVTTAVLILDRVRVHEAGGRLPRSRQRAPTDPRRQGKRKVERSVEMAHDTG